MHFKVSPYDKSCLYLYLLIETRSVFTDSRLSHFWRRSVIRLHLRSTRRRRLIDSPSLVLITRAHIITCTRRRKQTRHVNRLARVHVSANKDAAIKFCHANLSVCRQRWMERDCGNVMKPARNNVVQHRRRRRPAATRGPKWMRQTPQRGAQRPPTDSGHRAHICFLPHLRKSSNFLSLRN